MIIAIMSLSLLGLTLGLLLGLAGRYLKVEQDPIVNDIEAMLPGSQCGQCGFPGCQSAAEALAAGEAAASICPPGGRLLAEALAEKLGIDVDFSMLADDEPVMAAVKEDTCIGCTRCFKVCPTDAIVGAPKQIHAVFKEACTGCKACVEVCPTECLQVHPIKLTLSTWSWPKPALAA